MTSGFRKYETRLSFVYTSDIERRRHIKRPIDRSRRSINLAAIKDIALLVSDYKRGLRRFIFPKAVQPLVITQRLAHLFSGQVRPLQCPRIPSDEVHHGGNV